MIEIRPIVGSDSLMDISGIYERSWKSAYRGMIPDVYLDGIPEGKWADGLQNSHLHSLVMIKDGKMIGTSAYCASRMESMPGYGEIVSIYLLPEYTHQGYGGRLLTAALSQLEEMGYQDVFLWVLEENMAARKFYEEFGFRASGLNLKDNIGGKDLREVQYIYHMQGEAQTVLNHDVIRLEQAARYHRKAAEEMKQEFFQHGETVINGSALFDQLPFDAWLQNTNRNHHPETVRSDWAVATTFFAVRQSDEKLLGMIDVRHELSVPFLQEYGGHIGYAVRPSERRKGYATLMLKLALGYCRSLGIASAMLGCYTDNEASIRTIERCGGARTQEKVYIDGKPMVLCFVPTDRLE